MAGGNVTIFQFATTSTNPVNGDRIAGWQTTASQTVQFLASQVVAYTFSTTPLLTGQSTATSATAGAVSFTASTPVGFLVISVNGTSVKLPYFNT